MAIDRLSSTSALIAGLRTELARRAGKASRSAEAGESKAADGASRKDIRELRRQLVELVQAVPEPDPEALDKLRPRFVRAVLLWEYGPALREHPDWQNIFDTIVTTLASDPVQQECFASLVKELRNLPNS